MSGFSNGQDRLFLTFARLPYFGQLLTLSITSLVLAIFNLINRGNNIPDLGNTLDYFLAQQKSAGGACALIGAKTQKHVNN
jgi:hypothetical protein